MWRFLLTEPAGAAANMALDAGLLDRVINAGAQMLMGTFNSADTAAMLRVNKNLIARSIPCNAEADSLNCAILAPDVTPDDPEFDLFIKEVAREMTAKAGQKCTAIRRTLVPRPLVDAVATALKARLTKIVVGDPAVEGVRMGALASKAQQSDVAERVAQFRDQVRRRISGELTEEEFLPLRLQNGLYYQRHAYMLSVAIPYGHLRANQMRMLSHIAAEHDRGYGHFSTRQNIQYNWIKLEEVPDILSKLASVEMHAIQTSGNCIRNITADAMVGVAEDEIIDARPYCEVLRQWSTLHPEFAFLPRKFKIAVSGAKEDRAATAPGAVAVVGTAAAERAVVDPDGATARGAREPRGDRCGGR